MLLNHFRYKEISNPYNNIISKEPSPYQIQFINTINMQHIHKKNYLKKPAGLSKRTPYTLTAKPGPKKRINKSIDKEKAIFVGGITPKTNIEQLSTIMSKFGKVRNVEISTNEKGQNRGFCFVSFEHKSAIQKALSSGNQWIDGRLLSIRPMRSGADLEDRLNSTRENRITIYGFPKKLSTDQKNELQDYFSSLGKLEIYYFVNMRCAKIVNSEINHYIKTSLHLAGEKKVTLLNLSYHDVEVTKKLLKQKLLSIGTLRLKVSTFTIYKEFKQRTPPAKTRGRELKEYNEIEEMIHTCY